MTEQEAIEKLKADNCVECGYSDNATRCDYGACGVAIATRMAIKALEEVQQYREIGTQEECREAVEKQKEYDVEKVIEQIKSLSKSNYVDRNKVIEIVRGGGIE